MADLRAGAGRSRIVLSDAFHPVGGYGTGHDPLRMRVLLLDDGRASLTLAAVDRCLPADAHAGIRRVLAHVTHQDPVRVLVCAGHVHQPGPTLVLSETVQNAIENAAAWAAFAARSTCRAARLGRDEEGELLEDTDKHPIALLLAGGTGPRPAEEIEHAHHDEFVALFLTPAALSCVAELLDSAR